jgi:hypothetical protein
MQESLTPPVERQDSVEYHGVHCALTIRRPAPGVAVVVLSGTDVGEFADRPMQELAKDLEQFRSVELFIDARAVRSASIEVSSAWASWMRMHRAQLRRISMLTGSRYIEVTAEFVRRFAELMDRMRIFTDARAFDESLDASVEVARLVAKSNGNPKQA